MAIQIVQGFVRDFDEGSSSPAPVVATTFQVGTPPKQFFSPVSAGRLLTSGDYAAVAGMGPRIPGLGYLALAYRHLGRSGSAHLMNPFLPGLCTLIGLGGLVAVVYPGPLDSAQKQIVTSALAAGAFGAWILWSMFSACRMLNKVQASLTTRQSRT